MDTRLIQSDLLFTMAGIADFISLFFQDELGDQAMPEMTFFTFVFLDNFVDIFHPQILL